LYNRKLSIWELLSLQDGSLPEFYKTIKEMERENIIKIENGKVFLNIEENFLKNISKIKSHNVRCNSCEGTGYIALSEIEKEYREIVKNRPKPIQEFDQGYISPEGVLRRVSFIFERGDLLDTSIFIVGDDDLLSIAAGLTGLPSKIIAVDIDERIIDFINKVSKKYKLNIEASIYDVQQPLSKELRKKFDVFISDPVETFPGIKLFLSRGVSALKGVGSSGYFGLTTLEASMKKWYKIQKLLHKMGFVITDIRRKFSVYGGKENFIRYQDKMPIVKKLGVEIDYDWYYSSFYRIEAIKDPVPAVTGRSVITKDMYIDNESWATSIG
jgi:hypothetical protein